MAETMVASSVEDAGQEPESYREALDALRCHETSWLRTERSRVVVEQRRLKARELAITKVLDERRALDVMPDPTVSTRTRRQTLEVARALESTPALADVVWRGELSWEQTEPASRVATPETDAEWARRAPNFCPADLERVARDAKAVTPEDATARRQARFVRTWREPDAGMVSGRFRLPDVDGVVVEEVLEFMAERIRPAKGEAWDSLAHRKADALVDLATNYASVNVKRRRKPLFITHAPRPALHPDDDTTPGAHVSGMPIANETARQLSKDARVEHWDTPTIPGLPTPRPSQAATTPSTDEIARARAGPDP
jgi:hypothetical protein